MDIYGEWIALDADDAEIYRDYILSGSTNGLVEGYFLNEYAVNIRMSKHKIIKKDYTKLKYFMLGVIVTLLIAASIAYGIKQDNQIKADKAQCIKSVGKWHRHYTGDGQYSDVHCGEFEELNY